ncbi:hypothetical protein BS78_02G390300 [Paspalum vaginatum]|nr:hypothetical protein BS78_02G390300 [Paspalum vaginatum]
MASCCCVECKPCNGHCVPVAGLFKCRRPAQQLRRAFGKMKPGGGTRRRRRRAGSFSSVRAVFWPLMSMRSEADARADDAVAVADAIPPSAPAAATDEGAGAGAASTTAAGVLALQARLGDGVEGESARAAPAGKASGGTVSLSTAAREERGEVEAACRSFEAHLMEMLVEERKVLDLTDVEELLCCWEELRCPAFVRLVGRFYGELCMDLFSSAASEPEDPDPERLALVVGLPTN